MAVIPTPVVDALPERLWFYGNQYQVFGRDVHFCVADGMHRTIEVDGDEVGRGRVIGDVAPAPDNEDVRLWLSSIDFGWLAAGVIAVLVALVTIVRRVRA
jgi:hypothetical protein